MNYSQRLCCLELFEACFPRRLITRYQLLIALLERKFFVLAGTSRNNKGCRGSRVSIALH